MHTHYPATVELSEDGAPCNLDSELSYVVHKYSGVELYTINMHYVEFAVTMLCRAQLLWRCVVGAVHLLRYESSSLKLYKELSSSIFQSLCESGRHA